MWQRTKKNRTNSWRATVFPSYKNWELLCIRIYTYTVYRFLFPFFHLLSMSRPMLVDWSLSVDWLTLQSRRYFVLFFWMKYEYMHNKNKNTWMTFDVHEIHVFAQLWQHKRRGWQATSQEENLFIIFPGHAREYAHTYNFASMFVCTSMTTA